MDLGAQDILALGSDYDGSDPPDWLLPVGKLETLYRQVAKEFGGQLAEQLFFQNAMAFWKRFEAGR